MSNSKIKCQIQKSNEQNSIGVEGFCAIIYHALGLRGDDSIIDHSGRPMHLLPGGEVLSGLL